MKQDHLKLVVMDNMKDFGKKVQDHLQTMHGAQDQYIVPVTNSRFANGEGKIRLEESVRNQDLYILADVGNYDVTYPLHGRQHQMSPDEHFQDIKRVILASSGYADQITVVMPLLYQARQHKRKGRESLDCAFSLQELERMGVNHIVTFDAHDPSVSNAVPMLPFENIYPTQTILEVLKQQEEMDSCLVISPDMGATERARYYAECLGCDVGVFYKRRDLSQVIDGKNPIVEHVYLGTDVVDKTIFIVDDMIASGTSMIEVAKEVKQRGAKKVYFIATFALFTEGISMFQEAYEQHLFDQLYTTNLSYVPEDIRKQPWFSEVDCSSLVASMIDHFHSKKRK